MALINFYDDEGRLDYQTEVEEGRTIRLIDFDQQNINPWATSETLYDALGRVSQVRLTLDDGSLTVFDRDRDDEFAWLFATTVYTADGTTLNFSWTFNDDGSSVYADNDEGGGLSLTILYDYFDAQGRFDREDIYYDDGTYTVQDFDETGASNEAFTITRYNAAQQAVGAQTRYDDGSQVAFTYDYLSAQEWTEIRERYDTFRRLDYVETIYDDGRRAFADYDAADLETWDNILSFYTASGDLLYRVQTEDDGSFARVDYDLDNSQPYQWLITNYSVGGQVISQRQLADDGQTYDQPNPDYDPTNTYRAVLDGQGRLDFESYVDAQGVRTVTDYDQEGSQPWTRSFRLYDSQGRLDFQETFNDDNSYNWFDYDQSELYSWRAIEVYYDSERRLDTQWTYNDDGSAEFFDADQGNHEIYLYYTDYYDSFGRFAYEDKVFRDGTSNRFNPDETGEFDWGSILSTFAADGRLISEKIKYDNLTSIYIEYDIDDEETYASFVDVYDRYDLLTSRTYTNDDGSTTASYLDLNNEHWWSSYTFETTALGDLRSFFVQSDNGQSQSTEYEVDGARVVTDRPQGGSTDVQWTRLRYDSENRVDYYSVLYQDGSSLFLDYDEASANVWTTIYTVRDTLERVTVRVQDNDDGSRTQIVHDTADEQWWASSETGYDPSGRVAFTVVTADTGETFLTNLAEDGSRVETTTLPTGDIAQYVDTYDTEGRLDTRAIHLRSGAVSFVDFDETGTEAWTTVIDTLTEANGDVTSRTTNYDDGSLEYTAHDVFNAVWWTSYSVSFSPTGGTEYIQADADTGETYLTQYAEDGSRVETTTLPTGDVAQYVDRYDTLGRLDTRAINLRDGSVSFVDFDQAGAQAWSTQIDTFLSVGGATTSRTTNYDDGSVDYTAYDPLDAMSWTNSTISFSATGRTVYTNVVSDDGQTYLVQYAEDGSRVETTTLPSGNVSQIVDRFDTLGRLDTRAETMSDGTVTFTDFDQAGAQNWSRQIDTLTAPGGSLTSRTTILDTGAVDFTALDPTDAFWWASSVVSYNSSGVTTYTNVTGDDGDTYQTQFAGDGSRIETTTLPTGTVAQIVDAYDTLGRLDTRAATNRDGSVVFTDFDQAGAADWASIIDTFVSAGGALNSRQTNFDNGSSATQVNDLADAFDWTTFVTVRDTEGRLDYEDITYDNNFRDFKDYDNNGTETWQYRTWHYNADGVHFQTTILYDDGTLFVG